MFQGPPQFSPIILAQVAQQPHTPFTSPPLQFNLYNGAQPERERELHERHLRASVIARMAEITKPTTRIIFMF